MISQSAVDIVLVHVILPGSDCAFQRYVPDEQRYISNTNQQRSTSKFQFRKGCEVARRVETGAISTLK